MKLISRGTFLPLLRKSILAFPTVSNTFSNSSIEQQLYLDLRLFDAGKQWKLILSQMAVIFHGEMSDRILKKSPTKTNPILLKGY